DPPDVVVDVGEVVGQRHVGGRPAEQQGFGADDVGHVVLYRPPGAGRGPGPLVRGQRGGQVDEGAERLVEGGDDVVAIDDGHGRTVWPPDRAVNRKVSAPGGSRR